MKTNVCPVCGKSFIRPQLSVYKVTIDGRRYWCCGWTCYNFLKDRKNNRSKDTYENTTETET